LTVYPLAPLARVRKLREDAAGVEYAKAERALLEAREKVKNCELALADYARWRQEEEERRYQARLFTEMSLNDLDAFKADLLALRDRENSLAEELVQAEKAAEDALQVREQAHQGLLRARRESEKIEVHRNIWLAEEAKEAERREDVEMEEFSGRKPAVEEENPMENAYD
jgi:type III secretion protein O